MASTRHSFTQRLIFTAAIAAAGVSGAASADDSSMAVIGGDSYRYFNSQPIDNGPSSWRREHPHGLSEREYQSYSGVGPAWHQDAPMLASAPSEATFARAGARPMTETEYQALSSGAPTYQIANALEASAALASNDEVREAPRETFASRLARLFHPARSTQAGNGG
jgi:hypothetical protein